jgi:hypothetical protein
MFKDDIYRLTTLNSSHCLGTAHQDMLLSILTAGDLKHMLELLAGDASSCSGYHSCLL